MPVLSLTRCGLYCAAGNFYIDPWPGRDFKLKRSVITHGHADHARPGSQQYYCTAETGAIMHARIDPELHITPLQYAEPLQLGDALVSLHPAGHVLGSAQVRVEVDGEVWVASGDFKRDYDPTCAAFEVVPCDVFITEATFALPIYRWRSGAEIAADIYDWWQRNAKQQRSSVLFCYALGKAQRVLAELAKLTDDTVLLHGAMQNMVAIYRRAGVPMTPTLAVTEWPKDELGDRLVVAPPSAAGSPWMRRFKQHSTGFVSGWMRVRGNRRRRGYDRGFVMSDHADWPSLIQTVEQSGARQILATHGKTEVLVRYLRERGIAAQALSTPFGDEEIA